MLSPKRDLIAAKLFLRLALSAGGPQPRVLNVDGHPAYPIAIAELKQSGELGRRCRCRTAPYLNNVIEQDHRFIKKRVTASLGFRSAEGAGRTIEGYEAMHAIRKGQIRGSVANTRRGSGDQQLPPSLLRRNTEDRVNELALTDRITLGQPSDLPFANSVHRLISLDRSTSTFY